MDGVVESTRYNAYLAGVTLSVVKGGEIVLLKGYGYASIDPERAVDPERSLFRIGSISKTFVWTALMQLEARGLISLDDPVNDHLPEDLRIPDDGFEEPIRIRHLMAHTPGFENAVLGHMMARDERGLRTLREYLGQFRPRRVRPPGEFIAYSNYGAALAGYIAANASEVDFETYVEENIYEPLGMTRSTFREPYGDAAPAELPSPMPKALAVDLAQGLEWSEGAWLAQDDEYLTQIGPAGSMSSTAADMARFMLAHLGHGEPILDQETARRMHQKSFSNAEGMRGIAHGFVEWDLPGGPSNVGHNGGTLHFMSNMVMVPPYDLGIFVATNSGADGAGLFFVNSLPYLIVGHFFGEDSSPIELEANPIDGAEKYAGSYRTTRRSYTQLEKIIALAAVTEVSVTDDGYLLTSGPSETTRWVEVGPHLFREVGGERSIAFREGDRGRITHLFYSYATSERIGFFEGMAWLNLILSLGVLTAIGMTTGAWLRWGRIVEQSQLEKRAGQLMALLGSLWLAFFVAAGIAVAGILADDSELIYRFPAPALSTTLILLLLCAPLTFVALASLIPVWRGGSWPVWRCVRHSLAALVLTVLLLTLNDWNLVGFKYF